MKQEDTNETKGGNSRSQADKQSTSEELARRNRHCKQNNCNSEVNRHGELRGDSIEAEVEDRKEGQGDRGEGHTNADFDHDHCPGLPVAERADDELEPDCVIHRQYAFFFALHSGAVERFFVVLEKLDRVDRVDNQLSQTPFIECDFE